MSNKNSQKYQQNYLTSANVTPPLSPLVGQSRPETNLNATATTAESAKSKVNLSALAPYFGSKNSDGSRMSSFVYVDENDFPTAVPLTSKDKLTPDDFRSNRSNMSARQVEIVEKSVEVQEYQKGEVNMHYSRIVLGMILLCQIANQWQRAFVSSVYNFTYEGEQTDPYYNIQAAIPSFTPLMYSVLAGPAFMFLFGTLSLFSGMLSDVYNRRNLLCFSCIIWSATTFLSGYCNSFTTLLTLRILLSIFEENCAPNCYGLIVDYFPPHQRTSANAIYALGIYLGAGLTNFAIILISQYGWRNSYFIVGALGMVSGVFALLIIREPKRDRFIAISKDENEVLNVAEALSKISRSQQNLAASQEQQNQLSPRTKLTQIEEQKEQENLTYLSDSNTEKESFQIDVKVPPQQVPSEFNTSAREQLIRSDPTMFTVPLSSQQGEKVSATNLQNNHQKEGMLKFYWRGFKNILGNSASKWAFIAGCARFWQNQIVVYFSLTYFQFFENEALFGLVNGWAIILGGVFSNMMAGRIADKYESVSYKTKPMICIIMSLLCVPCFIGAFLTSFSFWFCMFWLALENFTSEGYTPVNIAIIQTVVDPEFKGMAVRLFRCLQTYAFAIGFLLVGKLTEIFTTQTQIGYIIGIMTIIPSVIAAYGYYKCMAFYVAQKSAQDMEKDEALTRATYYVSDLKSMASKSERGFSILNRLQTGSILNSKDLITGPKLNNQAVSAPPVRDSQKTSETGRFFDGLKASEVTDQSSKAQQFNVNASLPRSSRQQSISLLRGSETLRSSEYTTGKDRSTSEEVFNNL